MARIHFFHHDDPPSTCEFPITSIKPSSFFSANGRIRRGELLISSFILSWVSAIFRALKCWMERD
jgi:hypothetical protein